ncbi:hypothetical protein HDE_12881 [Halotydeus destructor]|nr:hypothetical protein HDE_12881 [Halotydeus destructor]
MSRHFLCVILITMFIQVSITVSFFKGADYFASTATMKYQDALEYCSEGGGHLARIKELGQQKFVLQYVAGSKAYWIDARKNDQGFVWSDNNTLTWANWYRGHPKCTMDTCGVYVDDDNTWMTIDYSGGALKMAACERTAVDKVEVLNETLRALLDEKMETVKSSIDHIIDLLNAAHVNYVDEGSDKQDYGSHSLPQIIHEDYEDPHLTMLYTVICAMGLMHAVTFYLIFKKDKVGALFDSNQHENLVNQLNDIQIMADA